MVNLPQGSGIYRARNSTADRALDILMLYATEKSVWSCHEIAGRLGVARSTAYRYVRSLLSVGFLEEAVGGFRLGPRIIELAMSARSGLGLSGIALPIMRSLANRVNATVLLTKRSGHAVLCVEVVRAKQVVSLSYERGHILPINAGAPAEVLLAWADPREIAAVLEPGRLERFTPRTLTHPDALRLRFAHIRRRGVAISRGELDEHILGVSAPVRNPAGAVCAAVSIAVPAARISPVDLAYAVSAVRDAATTLSRQLELQYARPTCPAYRNNAFDTQITSA
jgi:DNA-binding IclR family transcriptional regulator